MAHRQMDNRHGGSGRGRMERNDRSGGMDRNEQRYSAWSQDRHSNPTQDSYGEDEGMSGHHHMNAAFHHDSAAHHHRQAAEHTERGRHDMADLHHREAYRHGEMAYQHGQNARMQREERAGQRGRGYSGPNESYAGADPRDFNRAAQEGGRPMQRMEGEREEEMDMQHEEGGEDGQRRPRGSGRNRPSA